MKHRIVKFVSNGKIQYSIQRKEFIWGWLNYNTSPFVNGYHNTYESALMEVNRITNKPTILEITYNN
jgi:hypothetical protein